MVSLGLCDKAALPCFATAVHSVSASNDDFRPAEKPSQQLKR
jgi:hypothetical protein